MDAAEKLRIALLKILNLNNLKLFGCLIYNFKINIVTDEVENGTAYVGIFNGRPTISIFKNFIEEKTVQELMFVLLHEIMHILHGHTLRRGDQNHIIYNMAGDHVINNTLRSDLKKGHLNQLTCPKEAYIIEELTNKNLTTQEVYDFLLKNTKISETQTIQMENGMSVSVTEMDVNGQKIIYISDVNQSCSTSPEEQEEHQKITDNLKSEVRSLMNDERISRGLLSGDLKNMIMDIIQVEIPWDKLLEKTLLTKIKSAPDHRIWTNPMKRLRAHGIIMPGHGTKKVASTVAFIIDTSGSISNDDLKKFTSVVLQSINAFETVWLIKHDVDIKQNLILKTSEVEHSNFTYDYAGRGGTSHKQTFDIIEQNYKNKTLSVDLIIMLTDFESDIESIWNKYNWTSRIPVCIICTERHTIPDYIDSSPIYI